MLELGYDERKKFEQRRGGFGAENDLKIGEGIDRGDEDGTKEINTWRVLEGPETEILELVRRCRKRGNFLLVVGGVAVDAKPRKLCKEAL